MRRPHVTFVIATYKRVDALRCTLRSLLLQAHTDWTALVIGDCCGDETAEMIGSLREPRIRYYNLPRRCGEQSGPNTAGLHLAEGEFVSFLNHDDLLLGDHLFRALGQLDARGADFYIGKFANATRLDSANGGGLAPVFTGILPESADLRLLTTHYGTFDPSSFWLIRMPYARAVGPWRAAAGLWRTPLDDWLMRAWRLGGTFAFGGVVTGLRLWTHNVRDEGPVYSYASPEHEAMIRRIEQEVPDATRSFLDRQIDEAGREESAGSLPRRASVGAAWRASSQSKPSRALRIVSTALYLRFGVDLVGLAFRALGREGGGLDRISRWRTGEGLPMQPSLEDFLCDPEAYRVV